MGKKERVDSEEAGCDDAGVDFLQKLGPKKHFEGGGCSHLVNGEGLGYFKIITTTTIIQIISCFSHKQT